MINDPLTKGLELANILKNSNVTEVKELAQCFLALEVTYDALRHSYVDLSARHIRTKHSRLLESLRDDED